ncbi:MAG: Rrf2 family transcriptional regulator [Planctomycetaceae bacterium]|jgi:Rrf2 family protein|nr:Rrf2 family transcriptional regulator [Planctomycetaceae bacterium]
MKISTKGRYGLRILLDIAIYGTENKPRTIREVAINQEISEKYISRLIIELRKSGLVASVRGAAGGFKLGKSPEDVTILEIFEVMEGPINLVDCVNSDLACNRTKGCVPRVLWSTINQSVREIFARYTLKDLIDIHKANNFVEIEYCI